jgi:hypothetical protein
MVRRGTVDRVNRLILNALIVVLVWTSKSFFTIQGAVKFLNELPQERSVEAKIFEDKFVYVVYRIEEDVPVPVKSEQ